MPRTGITRQQLLEGSGQPELSTLGLARCLGTSQGEPGVDWQMSKVGGGESDREHVCCPLLPRAPESLGTGLSPGVALGSP